MTVHPLVAALAGLMLGSVLTVALLWLFTPAPLSRRPLSQRGER